MPVGFFLGAQISDIKKDNMYSFLAWAMYSADFEQLTEEEKSAVLSMTLHIASETNLCFEDGYNPNVTHIKMTLNPIAYYHRPLAIYLGSAVKNVIGDMVLRWYGFKLGLLGNTTYWYKQPIASDSPMLFFHGITSGWIFYLPVILRMSGSRSVILVDLDTIKVKSLVFDMPDEKEFVANVKDICLRHFGVGTPVSVVGHSFGTITAAWFLRAHPDLVSHLTLLDPGKVKIFAEVLLCFKNLLCSIAAARTSYCSIQFFTQNSRYAFCRNYSNASF